VVAAVAAHQQKQRQRDAARGDHVQVPRLRHAVRRVRERRRGSGRAERAKAELAREKVGAEEAQRPREKEEQVVANERGDGARAEERRGTVPEQRVREREAERVRVERV
jgi:hypothetical protein